MTMHRDWYWAALLYLAILGLCALALCSTGCMAHDPRAKAIIGPAVMSVGGTPWTPAIRGEVEAGGTLFILPPGIKAAEITALMGWVEESDASPPAEVEVVEDLPPPTE